MASEPYKNVLEDPPADGVTYWARLVNIGYPYQAVWRAVSQSWESAGGLLAPWWVSPLYRDL